MKDFFDYETMIFIKVVLGVAICIFLLCGFLFGISALIENNSKRAYEYCIEKTGKQPYCWNKYIGYSRDSKLDESK